MVDRTPLPSAPVPEPEDDAPPETPALRRLRWLVTALAGVMIVGMVVVSAALVIRLGQLGGGLAAPIAAEAIALPEGADIRALGRSGGEVLVLTHGPGQAERLWAIDAETGEIRSVTQIRREAAGSGSGDDPPR